jgi:hypothetical protein
MAPEAKLGSLTLTPTYQFNIFFVRAEASYVKATNATAGLVFGPLGNDTSQVRGIAELGVLF